jgi:hypothetical protein
LALVSFMQVLMTASKQSQDGTAVCPWHCLEAVIKSLHETYHCQMYNGKTPWWWAKKMPKTCRIL